MTAACRHLKGFHLQEALDLLGVTPEGRTRTTGASQEKGYSFKKDSPRATASWNDRGNRDPGRQRPEPSFHYRRMLNAWNPTKERSPQLPQNVKEHLSYTLVLNLLHAQEPQGGRGVHARKADSSPHSWSFKFSRSAVGSPFSTG